MSHQQCRWGIIGTAAIARKNWHAIYNAPSAVLTAVASRSVEKAETYINELQGHCHFPETPVACGSYEELLARDDIDAVYIPLPTGLRKEWVLKAAAAGKHVLCEKPCGVSVADLQEMLDACATNNIQFMDGVMFMHSGRMAAMRKVLDDGESVGTMKRITSQFSFLAPEEFTSSNIRANGSMEPFGCLGDLGWYNVRFSLWATNYELPYQVIGRELSQHSREDDDAVPMEFSGELFFKEGVSASFYCSFVTQNQEWANISGTNGYLHLDDFVLPFYGCESAFEVSQTQFVENGVCFDMQDHTVQHAVHEYSNNMPGAQETNLFQNFSELALSGNPDPKWGEIALKTQRVIDALLESARNGSQPVEIS